MKELINIIKDHISYKQQIGKLAKADLVKTYRGSALGWAWAIVKPAVTIFVYWFAFSIGLRVSKTVGDFPFFLWLVAGVVPWFYMSDMLVQGTQAIRKYSYLVTKMKFPVATIPTFVSLSKLIVHAVLMVLVIAIFWAFGYPPDLYTLQIFFYLILMFAFFTAWALFASLLAAISKDFANLVKSFVTALFWLSGIMWNVHDIGIPWIQKVLMFNPITFLIDGYRNCFVYKTWFFEEPIKLLCFGIVLVVMILLSLWAYHKLRKEIADVL